MTALTTAQLDELERRAQRAKLAVPHMPWFDEDINVTLHLVAIARAALAWSEARWKHSDAALAHGLLSYEARLEFQKLDPLTEALDAVVQGEP